MSSTPEIPISVPEVPKAPEGVSEIPEAVEQGQSVVQQQPVSIQRPTTTVTAATQSPSAPASVTIPADPAQLATLAKGKPENALTWFANFWLRMIKKALGVGASIMTSQSIKIPAPADPVSAIGTQGVITDSGTKPATSTDNSVEGVQNQQNSNN